MVSLLNIFPVIYPPTAQHKSETVSSSWQILEDDFPSNGSSSQQLKFLLNYATLALTSHNTQPWTFKIVDEAVELYLNKPRILPVNDLNCRELTISCGAALFHLCLAIRHFGYKDVVEILPEPLKPNLLARICMGSKRIARVEENFLFRAISKKCANPLSLSDRQIPTSLISELELATCTEGNWLQIMTQTIAQDRRLAVIDLIARGDRLQMSNSRSREKLAQWIRSCDLMKSQAAKDCQLASQAPVLMLINSNDDTPWDWLATGQALAHLLLRARIDDVWASFFNQPIQVPQLRSRLQELFPDRGYPQILLRLGYARETTPITRKTANEVIPF